MNDSVKCDDPAELMRAYLDALSAEFRRSLATATQRRSFERLAEPLEDPEHRPRFDDVACDRAGGG